MRNSVPCSLRHKNEKGKERESVSNGAYGWSRACGTGGEGKNRCGKETPGGPGRAARHYIIICIHSDIGGRESEVIL